MLHWLRSDRIDPLVHNQVALLGFAFMLNKVRPGRSDGSLPEDQFVDSHYRDLMDDPAEAIRKIYEQAGLPWPKDHDATLRTYLRDEPKGRFGAHEYELDALGLDEESIRSTYADYVDYYGVERED